MGTENSKGMLTDIFDIPEVLRKIYQLYVENGNPFLREAANIVARDGTALFTGMVTSEFSAYPMSIMLNKAGVENCVMEAGELLHYHKQLLSSASCIVAISQSGESGEIRNLVESINGKTPIIGIFNDEMSYLAHNSDIGLAMQAGPQLACGTKTNVATLALMSLLTEAVVSADRKPSGEFMLPIADQIDELIDNWEEVLTPVIDMLFDAPSFIFLGRGPGLSSARFSAVLFREVLKVISESFSTASFRHGIMEMIKPDTRVVIFAPSGTTYDLSINFARELYALKVQVVVVTDRTSTLQSEDGFYILKTGIVPEIYSPIFDIVPFQLIGYKLALRKGLIPGRLEIAQYVTKVE